MPTEKLFGLLGQVTVAQLLAREDFRARMEQQRPLSVLELLYPILQGYDSVAIESDLELGGTDQKFNLLLARDLQQAYGQPGQSVITTPILPGLDGERRMSKSLGNYVGVADPPEEMFGKLMSIPDAVMGTYYELLLGERQPPGLPAVEAKRALAERLVDRFHGAGAGTRAEARFDRVHKQGEIPDEVPEASLGEINGLGESGDEAVHLPALIAAVFGVSSSEARRLLKQGGVKLDGDALDGDRLELPRGELEGRVIQLGKRRFTRLRP
jgi:tyrosyl-tRNA synthetase